MFCVLTSVYMCVCSTVIYFNICFHSDVRRAELSAGCYLRVCSLILWELL